LSRFQTLGRTWAELARLGELNAVLSPMGSERTNRFLHSVHSFGARVALNVNPNRGVLVDFGCGTGRFVRFFGQNGFSVIGTDITLEMLAAAKRFGLHKGSTLVQTDGISIPVDAQSVDMVWVCGVLKFSLLVPDPAYKDIAEEMYRVLKPDGLVVSLEVHVDTPPEVFTYDFEQVGFRTKDIHVLQRYDGRLEKLFQSLPLPLWCVDAGGKLCAALRFRFDHPKRRRPGLRDYLFVWSKPKV
jgi:SAM-dependent methyltransferase